jgi:hypothetical protein
LPAALRLIAAPSKGSDSNLLSALSRDGVLDSALASIFLWYYTP